MPTTSLYSYCIPYDDGAAPNPYWGVCTLVICKPAIRSTAQIGDWIVGTGAKHARLGNGSPRDMSGRVVYAMRVTAKMTMPEYDAHTRTTLPGKIPSQRSPDPRRRLGDSLYNFSKKDRVVQRQGVHSRDNQATDLRGKHALLSTQFYYFGDHAIVLPKRLRPIAQNQQGHRRALNDRYIDAFVHWIERLGYASGTVLGKPLCDLFANRAARAWCAAGRAEDDDADAEEGGC